jgi:two-component system, LytTR family, sensor histidine kinase AlgZ
VRWPLLVGRGPPFVGNAPCREAAPGYAVSVSTPEPRASPVVGGEAPSQLLPPEQPWLYVVIPLPAAYLMGHDWRSRQWPVFLRSLVEMYLPFIVYGLVFHVLYRTIMPRLVARVRHRSERTALHAAAVVVVTPIVAAGLLPAMSLLGPEKMGYWDFLLVSYIFTVACIFPSTSCQELRHRARSAEHRALTERKAALEAQLRALQARTDPHFLFNSLNTVASLIAEDPVLAERTVERLADLFRYALDSSRSRTVKLERELSMVADYLELQSARFGSRLHTSLHVERGLADIEVPPLLLQPLVENAIVHGTSQRREGRVDVTVRREHDQLVVEVNDDGPGPGRSSYAGAGTAIAGVNERLELHYAGRGSLLLQPHPEGGCCARLALPIGALT